MVKIAGPGPSAIDRIHLKNRAVDGILPVYEARCTQKLTSFNIERSSYAKVQLNID